MKYILIILSILLLNACNPLLLLTKTKEERQEIKDKKKAQKLIKRAIKRDPDILVPDTVLVRDTVIYEGVTADTVFSVHMDSVTLQKEKLIIRYRRIGDTIYLDGACEGDTVYTEKIVLTEKIKYEKKALTMWEEIRINLGNMLLFLLLALLLFA